MYDDAPTCPACGHALSMLAEDRPDRAERVALAVARAVASWWFVLALALVAAVWIAVNVLARPFGPYPMIMVAGLAVGLSAIAASYGPLILLTQRRAAARDRLRDVETYRVAARTEGDLHDLSLQVERLHGTPPMRPRAAPEPGERTDR